MLLNMDVDTLENLPKKESRREYLTRKFGDMWNIDKFDHSWIRSNKSDYPDIKARRILKKYLRKSFDKAFSAYCKLVPINEQKVFLDYFNNRSWRSADYMIDKQGRIQLNPERYISKKRRIIFYSHDYEYGYKNKRTGETISKKEIYLKEGNKYTWNENYYICSKDWEWTIISGYSKEFKSRKDKEYKKLMAEKAKIIKNKKHENNTI